MVDEVEVVEAPPEAPPEVDYEAEARKSGWSPQNTFPGDPKKWIDAKSWVTRGKEFIPFLQAANRDLKGQVGTLASQLDETRRTLQATTKAIAELKEGANEQTITATEAQRDALDDEIVKAHEDGDIKLELKLRDQRADVVEALREAKRPAVAATEVTRQTPSTVDATQSPEFQQFLRDNPWFKEDSIMAAAAVEAVRQINANSETVGWGPAQKYAEAAKIVKRRFGMRDNPRRESPSKVEGGRMEGTTGGGGGGKSYEDLPQEARSMCDALSKRFVGKTNGRGEVKYKDLAAYRAQYVSDFFAEDWGAKHVNQ
jgi:hypothetical protein